jgi:hypothetical protein
MVYMLTYRGYIDGIHVTIYGTTMDPMGYSDVRQLSYINQVKNPMNSPFGFSSHFPMVFPWFCHGFRWALSFFGPGPSAGEAQRREQPWTWNVL